MKFRIMIACAALFLTCPSLLAAANPSVATDRTLTDDKGRSIALLEVEGGGSSRACRYENTSFNYSVQIPERFDCAIVASDNNDGVELETKDKDAALSAYAAIDTSEKDVPQPQTQTAIKALIASLGDKIASRKTGPNFFTVFWRDGETDYYKKIVYKNGVFFTMDMNYPSALKSEYEIMAIRFGESLSIRD